MSTENNFRRLEAIIQVFGVNKTIWNFVDQYFQETTYDETQRLCLANVIDGFGLKPRAWEVLDKRCGFQRLLTLDEISVELGDVTRERVRQIQIKAMDKVKSGIGRILMPLLWLDEEVHRDWAKFEAVTTINEAIFIYQATLSDMGWEFAQGKEVRQLLLLIRALVYSNMLDFYKHFPHLSYVACRLAPHLLKHPVIADQERELRYHQAEQERNLTYYELAKIVLTEADAALHYMELARRAEDINRRDNFNIKGIHNVLLGNPNTFAYVDQGTYGLVSWGLVSVDTYNDIVADVLSTSGKALPFGNILHLVNAKRTVKNQSLQMTLDMHPRFYCSQEGTYGLRAWLPSREKQTLRTPKWQIETLQSYERVSRSTERGYDVEAIVTKDKG